MLTVQSLLDELDLGLAAGASGSAAPVRWVHISELQDPTPWLSGGELMLTTGIPLDSAAKQRAFVRILADRNLAGLGFGIGFTHQALPKALVDEARKRDFPLFEVPYSTPFIAITEKAFAKLVNEQYEVLQRGVAVQRRLERLVLEERGLICRADDRGDPVVQLAPPLIADTEQFEEIHDVLRAVLAEAWDRVVR